MSGVKLFQHTYMYFSRISVEVTTRITTYATITSYRIVIMAVFFTSHFAKFKSDQPLSFSFSYSPFRSRLSITVITSTAIVSFHLFLCLILHRVRMTGVFFPTLSLLQLHTFSIHHGLPCSHYRRYCLGVDIPDNMSYMKVHHYGLTNAAPGSAECVVTAVSTIDLCERRSSTAWTYVHDT